MLNWQTMAEDEFNRIAEQLIRRSVEEDNPGIVVTVPDGRGGDGGIDIESRVKRTGQLVAIYQLKYFPQGFSGEWGKARKPQVKSSFQTALSHDPPVWYLVVPRNLTPGERRFVHSLRGKRKRPRIRCIGSTELDALVVRFPDIEMWAQRDPLRSALEITGRSTAALSKPDDLSAEVTQLARRFGARSDYWKPNFRFENGKYFEELVALRPDSQTREPLSLRITTDFTQHPELGAAFQHSMDFGVTESLVLPPEVVSHFEKLGPEWFSASYGPSHLELRPATRALDVEGSVRLLTEEGRVLARRRGISTRVVGGSRGAQLIIDLGDNLGLAFLVQRDVPSDGQLNVTSDLTGLSGAAAKRALRFRQDLARAARVEVALDGHTNLVAISAGGVAPSELELELADDLAFIEDELNTTLAYPDGVHDATERVWVRVVRQILEGKVSLMPGVRGLNFTLSGESGPEFEDFLMNEGGVSQSGDGWELELFGQPLTLDDISMLMPAAKVVDGAEHLDALRRGNAAGRTIYLEPVNSDLGVSVWSPGRIGDLQSLAPSPWGIKHIDEHPQIRRRQSEPDE